MENENCVRGTEDHLSVSTHWLIASPQAVCARNHGGYPEDVSALEEFKLKLGKGLDVRTDG